jgi:hypothetical protein
MTRVADKLGLGKRKMDSISFHSMATAIHMNVTEQRGIKRHFNDWTGRRMFETDKALKDRIIENVIKPTTGFFEYAKDTIKYSQPRERVNYWRQCPALCFAQDIAGLVEEEDCTQQSEETRNDTSNRGRAWGRGLVNSHKSVHKRSK